MVGKRSSNSEAVEQGLASLRMDVAAGCHSLPNLSSRMLGMKRAGVLKVMSFGTFVITASSSRRISDFS